MTSREIEEDRATPETGRPEPAGLQDAPPFVLLKTLACTLAGEHVAHRVLVRMETVPGEVGSGRNWPMTPETPSRGRGAHVFPPSVLLTGAGQPSRLIHVKL